MSKKKDKKTNSFKGSKNLKNVYLVIKFGSNFLAVLALTSIAFSSISLKKGFNLFNDCVKAEYKNSSNISKAVNYCKGGI